jgi:hypothetical protein
MTRRNLYLTLVLCAFVLKGYMMTITPLSFDFTYAIQQTLFGQSPDAHAPYSMLFGAIYSLWLALPIGHPVLASTWGLDFFHASSSLYALVFLLKLPLLALDGAMGLLIYYGMKTLQPEKAAATLLIWAANPYVLLVNEMWAPVDMFPIFLLVLGLLILTIGKRTILSLISMSLSVALNIFSLTVFPIFLVAGRGRRRLLIGALAAAIAGTAAYLYWVVQAGYNLQGSYIYIRFVNFDSTIGITQHMTIGSLGEGAGQEVVGIGLVALIVVAVLVLEKWPRDTAFALDGALLLLLTFLAFSNWMPQYILWIIPLLTLDLSLRHRSKWYLAVLCASAFFFDIVTFYSYFTANSNAFFFVPASSELLKVAISGFEQFASNTLVFSLFAPLARVIFGLTCLIYVLKILDECTQLFSSVFGKLYLWERSKKYLKSRIQIPFKPSRKQLHIP